MPSNREEFEVICGHCHENHATVAEVRRCANSNKPMIRKDQSPSVTLTDGFYVIPEKVVVGGHEIHRTFKIQKARQCDSRGFYPLYAKELIEVKRDGTFEWEYLGKSAFPLLRREGRKLEKNEAQHLGKLYGCCIKCGRRLTKEESIARGMGDVCAEGW